MPKLSAKGTRSTRAKQDDLSKKLDLVVPPEPPFGSSLIHPPEVLAITPKIDNCVLDSVHKAKTLLSWCDDIYDADGAHISKSDAALLLETHPPSVCQKGKKIWIAGDVRLSKYLLSHAAEDADIKIVKLRANHPLALVSLPVRHLLAEPDLERKVEEVHALLNTLNPDKTHNQDEIASLVGRSQSAVSRILARLRKAKA